MRKGFWGLARCLWLQVFRSSCWLLLCGACLYDPDDRCGDDRHLEGRVCVCNAGSEERNGVCEAALPDAGAGGPGADCAADEDCEAAEHSICKRTPSGGGYCTRAECASDEDCPQSFFCVSDVSPSFCSRPPTGQGESCSSSADCQSFDATFCGVGDPRGATCWVPDCTDDSCEPGYMCFDLSQLLPGAPKACVR
jgi:hypothetical protein